MSDRLRVYRRWRDRRLGILLPSAAAGFAACAWIAWGGDAAPWLRGAALALAATALPPLIVLIADTLRCARALARREGLSSRLLRTRLSSFRGLTLASLAALALALVLPTLGPFRPAHRERPPLPEAKRPLPPREAAPAVALRPAPAAPQIVALQESPLEALEVDLPRVEPALPELLPPSPPLPPSPESAETLRFQPERLDLTRQEPEGVDRPGLPEELGDEPPPPAFRFEALLLRTDGYENGPGVELSLDLPLSGRTLLQGAFFAAGFERDEGFFEGDPDLLWERARLAVAHRLFGYGRRAPFDLSVAAGWAFDQIREAGIDDGVRGSPYLGLEMGVWEAGGWGLLLRAGHTLPTRLDRLSASVTDVSVVARVDLGERVSLHAGYRLFRLRLFTDSDDIVAHADEAVLDAALGGPLASVELRF